MFSKSIKTSISVIIPIYNAEKEIARCMESIYAQTFSDYEIILVNDGSKDNSAAVCRSFADKDNRVTFIDKENGGSGSARNAGIEVAKGKYIYFCDADDEIDKSLLERVYAEAENKSVDLVIFSVSAKIMNSKTGKIIREYTTTQKEAFFETRESFRSNFSHLYYEGVLFGGPINKLFKTDLIKNNSIRFPDLKRGQDEIFNMRYCRYVNSCAVIPDSLYTYYQFDNKGKNRKYRLNYFDTTTKTYFKTLGDLLTEFAANDEYSQKKFQNSFVYSMEAAILLAWNPLERLNRNGRIDFIKKVLNDDFVVSMSESISFIPDDYEEFWNLFTSNNAEKLYKYIAHKDRIEIIKKPLRKVRDVILQNNN